MKLPHKTFPSKLVEGRSFFMTNCNNTNDAPEDEEISLRCSSSPSYSPNLFYTDYNFFKQFDVFLQDEPKTQINVESAFRMFITSRITDFYVIRINKPVTRWKNCV